MLSAFPPFWGGGSQNSQNWRGEEVATERRRVHEFLSFLLHMPFKCHSELPSFRTFQALTPALLLCKLRPLADDVETSEASGTSAWSQEMPRSMSCRCFLFLLHSLLLALAVPPAGCLSCRTRATKLHSTTARRGELLSGRAWIGKFERACIGWHVSQQ